MQSPRAQPSLPFAEAGQLRFARPSTIEYKLVRSQRKTISIEVFPDGEVIVRSPRHVAEREVRDFVAEKFAWIVTQREAMLREQARRPKRRFVSGERLPYLGSDLVLRVLRDPAHRRRPEAQRRGLELWVYLGGDVAAAEERVLVAGAVQQWYRRVAADYLRQRVDAWSPQVGQRPNSIRVRSAKSRWGSCNTQTRSINFSWQLLTAPPPLVDYVVVHELCHLWVPNHSRRFWSKLGSVMPDFQQRRGALRTFERVFEL